MIKAYALKIIVIVFVLCVSTQAQIRRSVGTIDIYSKDSPGGFAVTGFDRIGQRSFTGYFDTQFKSDSSGAMFSAQHLALQVSSQLHEKLLANAELNYLIGDKQIEVRQAWLDFEIGKKSFLRTGVFIVPFGRLNVLNDADLRESTALPLYSTYLVPSVWSDAGAGVHGMVFPDTDLGFHYDLFVMNGLVSSGLNSSGSSAQISNADGLRLTKPPLSSDNNKSKSFVGRFSGVPLKDLEIGVSYYTGKHDASNAGNLSLTGLDLHYKLGSLELAGEWATAKISNTSVSDMDGYYVEAQYHFFTSLLKDTFLSKGFRKPEFTLFTRYSAVNLDKSAGTLHELKQMTAGLNYRPLEQVAFKIEYEINQEYSNIDNNAIICSVAVGF